MPIDRAATLRNAEKLLRQGKLDLAIGEYLRVVEDQPRDWNTANLLGDLYVRTGQVDRAVEQFVRIADHLSREGFRPKAAALYKKILKLSPGHEHALYQAAEIAASQGLLVDARAYLNAIADRRRATGDQNGAAQIRIRLGGLDPGDFDARLAAARARTQIGDRTGAIADFKAIATQLGEKGRQAEAIEAWREVARLSPEDQETRERLLQFYVAAGDFPKARECASTVAQFRSIAAALDAAGRPNDALEVLRDAARINPADIELRIYLARAFADRGDLEAAAEYLTLGAANTDLKLLLSVAETHIRCGKHDEALGLLRRLLDEDSSRGETIAILGWHIAESDSEAGFRVTELAADASVAQSDWASAAAALQEYVTRVPNHIPALMRLVEICVDGGLEATMYSAQAQLADAYIAAGLLVEARFIAEDLVAREPWERVNIERFRRALTLLGEPEPDAVIADRLSGLSPFTTMDLADDEDLSPIDPVRPQPQPEAPAPPSETMPRLVDVAAAAEPPRPPPPVHRRAAPRTPADAEEPDRFELNANGLDLDSILDELEASSRASAKAEHIEIDLSLVLDDFGREAPEAPEPVDAARQPGAIDAPDLDGVFSQLRDEASHDSAVRAAAEQYTRGAAFYEAGLVDASIGELRAAARTPQLRFQAASLLARIHRERGMLPETIEWFERAAAAPPSSAAEGHRVLYELADALEAVGELARALAICLELQADAGDYEDVDARIERLARVQTRG